MECREIMNRAEKDNGRKTESAEYKRIYAKSALLACLILMIPIVICFLLEIYGIEEINIAGRISLIVLFIWYLSLMGYAGFAQGSHWIKYGNGKVVVRRVSRECVNDRPVGKWRKREDTFSVEEIEAYGLSRKVLGHDLERHLCKIYKAPSLECFFRLKSGKMIGCSIEFYPRREMKAFFTYLYEKTGIPLQEEGLPERGIERR